MSRNEDDEKNHKDIEPEPKESLEKLEFHMLLSAAEALRKKYAFLVAKKKFHQERHLRRTLHFHDLQQQETTSHSYTWNELVQERAMLKEKVKTVMEAITQEFASVQLLEDQIENVIKEIVNIENNVTKLNETTQESKTWKSTTMRGCNESLGTKFDGKTENHSTLIVNETKHSIQCQERKTKQLNTTQISDKSVTFVTESNQKRHHRSPEKNHAQSISPAQTQHVVEIVNPYSPEAQRQRMKKKETFMRSDSSNSAKDIKKTLFQMKRVTYADEGENDTNCKKFKKGTSSLKEHSQRLFERNALSRIEGAQRGCNQEEKSNIIDNSKDIHFKESEEDSESGL